MTSSWICGLANVRLRIYDFVNLRPGELTTSQFYDRGFTSSRIYVFANLHLREFTTANLLLCEYTSSRIYDREIITLLIAIHVIFLGQLRTYIPRTVICRRSNRNLAWKEWAVARHRGNNNVEFRAIWVRNNINWIIYTAKVCIVFLTNIKIQYTTKYGQD